jgi:hypothetical protein
MLGSLILSHTRPDKLITKRLVVLSLLTLPVRSPPVADGTQVPLLSAAGACLTGKAKDKPGPWAIGVLLAPGPAQESWELEALRVILVKIDISSDHASLDVTPLVLEILRPLDSFNETLRALSVLALSQDTTRPLRVTLLGMSLQMKKIPPSGLTSTHLFS